MSTRILAAALLVLPLAGTSATAQGADSTAGQARRVADAPSGSWFRAIYSWRVSAGTSMADASNASVGYAQGPGTARTRVIGGGNDGRHFALSLTRAARGTAIDWRAELAYNAFSTGFPSGTRSVSGDDVRIARRDEAAALTLNGVFRATRGRRVTPYLLVGGGAYYGRVGYDTDLTDDSYDVGRWRQGLGVGVNAGGGLELSVGRFGAFAELRRHQRLTGVPGASFTPLSVGLRF